MKLNTANRKITLAQLRAFVAVSRTRSFTRAAELLSSSQPAVSATIQQLEAELNLKLFDRTTKELHLNAQSKASLPVIERLIGELDIAVEVLRETAEGRRGNVAIAVVPSIAINVLPQTIAKFTATYPNIKISLRDDNTAGVWGKVRDGEVDIGVAGQLQDGEGLVFETLLRDPFGVVLRSDHPLADHKQPMKWSDLAPYPFIAIGDGTGIKPLLREILSVIPNTGTPLIEGSNITTILALLKEGLGVTVLPELAVRSESPNLVFRKLNTPPLYRELGLITRVGRSLSPAADSFIKHMKDAMATL